MREREENRSAAIFRIIFGILLLTLCLGMGSVSASAKKVSTWYTSSSGKTYYYNESGKKLKNGKYKIGSKYYYFDSKGVQRTGWQKIGSKYYYFKIAKGKNGYMRHSTSKKTVKINGITLKTNGRAKMTSYAKKKLPVLYAANKKMQSITKPGDSKKTKLKKCSDYVFKQLKKSNGWVRLCNLDGGAYVTSGKSDWDIHYAKPILVDQSTNKADCNTLGCVFAYLANACGYTSRCVASGGHGWAEVKKSGKYYVYDLDWAVVKNSTAYCGLLLNGSYPSGAPNYKSAGYYKITI